MMKIQIKNENIDIQNCKDTNMNKDTKECKFKGRCIHQSILHKNIFYCLR